MQRLTVLCKKIKYIYEVKAASGRLSANFITPSLDTCVGNFGVIDLVEHKADEAAVALGPGLGEIVALGIEAPDEIGSGALHGVVDLADSVTESVAHRLVSATKQSYLFACQIESRRSGKEVIPTTATSPAPQVLDPRISKS